MKSILYIFPHPDDESFGPAGSIYQEKKKGNEVHLLTLTRGGATKMRHKLGFSIDEMGLVRVKEMEEVEKVLELSSMTIWDYPDGELNNLNPSHLEAAILRYIDQIKPDVVVTYTHHGISVHPDHLCGHAIIKKIYWDLRDKPYFNRLALFTVDGAGGKLNVEKYNRVDCRYKLSKEETDIFIEALSCYESYKDVINETGVIEKIGNEVLYEFYNEKQDKEVSSVVDGLE